MSALSSTSSSDRQPTEATSALLRLGSVGAGRPLILALLLSAAFIGALELRLAARGFGATVLDSPALWADWRERANSLGPRALAFVGASRMQLGIDLDEARAQTGLEAVQLAIDGSSPMPVLDDLARDARFRGTVVADVYPSLIVAEDRADAAGAYVAGFQSRPGHTWAPTFDRTEPWLRDRVRWSLASYADGASPLQSLLLRVLTPDATPGYLVTRPDRSREADYTKVRMPEFALQRAARNLEAGPWDYPGPRRVTTVAALDAAVNGIRAPAATPDTFLRGLDRLVHVARQLRGRGGDLLLLAMPTSGYVEVIDERRFPDALFRTVLDARMREEGVTVVWSNRETGLETFDCPDGSHLDRRDRQAFTAAAMTALGLARRDPPASGQ